MLDLNQWPLACEVRRDDQAKAPPAQAEASRSVHRRPEQAPLMASTWASTRPLGCDRVDLACPPANKTFAGELHRRDVVNDDRSGRQFDASKPAHGRADRQVEVAG